MNGDVHAARDTEHALEASTVRDYMGHKIGYVEGEPLALIENGGRGERFLRVTLRITDEEWRESLQRQPFLLMVVA